MKNFLQQSRLANKSSLMFLFLTLFSTTLLRGQVAGDYGSAATGNWGTTGANWLVFVANADWSDATVASNAPALTNNVWIRNGHNVTIEASGKLCNNLTVTGTLTSQTLLTTLTVGGSNLNINGTGVINGNLSGSEFGITLATAGTANQTLTIGGNTTTLPAAKFNRITPGAINATLNINIETELRRGATGSAALTMNSKPGFTVNVNAKLNIAAGYLSVSGASSGSAPLAAAAGNFTVNVYNELICANNVNLNNAIAAADATSFTMALRIYSGGTMTVGGNINGALNVAGQGVTNMTIDAGGTFNVTSTNCTLATSNVTINGVFDFQGSSVNVRNLGTCTIGNGGKLRMAVASSTGFPLGTVTLATNSTVEYYGSTVYTVPTTPTDYKNLVFNNSSNLTLGSALNVAGNLTMMAGTLTGNTVTLNGTTVQNLNGNGNAISALTLNNAAGVKLLSPTTIQTLTFTNGHLTLDNYNLTVNTAVTGGSMASHVVTNGTGSLKREVSSSALEFPVGVSASSYDLATLTNTGTTDTFSVRVDTILGNPPPNGAQVLKREWNIAETVSGGSTVAATFSISPNALNLNNGSFVAGAVTVAVPAMVNNTWNPVTTTFATPNATTTGLTTLNAFILANPNAFGVQPAAGTAAAVSTNLCIGSGTQLSITGATGDTLQWQSSMDSLVWANTNAAGANGFTATPSVSTYYRFRAATNLGEAFSNVVKLTVNPKPVPNFTASAFGYQATFTNTSTGGNSYFWRFGDIVGSNSQVASPTFAYASNGTYTAWLRVTSAAGCVDSISKIVTISAAIAGTVSASATNLCIGSSVTLSVTGASGDTLQWQTSLDSTVWTSTANAGAAALNATPTTTTYYRFRASNGNTVYSNGVKVTVNPKPVPNFTVSSSGYQATFTNTSTGGNSSFWRFGDIVGSNSQMTSPTFTYAGNGTYTVWLRVTSAAGCVDSISKIVTISTAIVAGTVSASTTSICIGSNVSLSVAGASGDTLQWQTSLDSAVWTNTANAGAAALNATPTMTTYYRFKSSGATTVYSNALKVTVNPKPVPNFTVSAMGYQATFTNTSTGNSSSAWRFGDAAGSTSPVASPTFTYASNGTYTAWLRVTSAAGCVDSISKIVTISAAIAGTVSASAMNLCIGSSVQVSVTGAIGDTLQWQTSLDSAVWTSTANAGAAALNVTPTMTTYYRFKSSGATTVYSNALKVTVNPKPIPSFTVSAMGYQATFTNTSTGGNSSFWKFGDLIGSNSQVTSPTFTYASNGTYTAWLRVTSVAGCVDSISKIVTISAAIAGTVSASATNLCIGSSVQVSVTGAAGDTLQWQTSLDSAVWTNTANAGAAALNVAPTVTTYYRFKSSGSGTVYSNALKVLVNPKPVPNFTFAVTGGQVVFTNTSTSGNTYAWRLGDAAASTSQVANPTFTYLSNGNYTVWLRATSVAGCVDSTSKIVAVTRVGLDETRLLYGVKVYPNPVQTVLNVEMTQMPLDAAEFVILDALGKVKHVETVARHTQIAVSEWSAGIYWMAIRRGGTLQLLDKILIQN
jgi:PKD repeat protein